MGIKTPRLLMACLLLPLTTAQAKSKPTVVLPPGSISPGKTLVIEIPTHQKQPPQLHAFDKEIPFYKSRQKNWRCLTQVPLDLSPGPKNLSAKVFIGMGSKSIQVSFTIHVSSADFGFETIKFEGDKEKLLNDPSEGEESLKIRAILQKLSDDLTQHWRGRFISPVPGRIISPFGMARKKIGQDRLDFHRGMDLAGPRGQPIKAPNDGVVRMAEEFKFHGKTVLLSHGQGVGSIYIHMENIKVKVGQPVKKGDILGAVGSSGLATGPHLHWGVYVHGAPVDPMQWLEEMF